MKEPTKADLAAAVTKLTQENAGLRDLLTAVSECAAAVPQAAADGERKELRRATHMLVSISLTADPAGHWAWGWGSGQAAGYLREQASEPVGYEVYKTPDDDDESGEDATVAVAASSEAEPTLHQLRMKALREGSPAVQDGPYAYVGSDAHMGGAS